MLRGTLLGSEMLLRVSDEFLAVGETGTSGFAGVSFVVGGSGSSTSMGGRLTFDLMLH